MQGVRPARPQAVDTLWVLAHEEQAFPWTVLLAGVATTGAGLRGVIRIHLDSQGPRQRGLVADERVQFGKGPLGVQRLALRALGETGSRPLPFFLRLRLLRFVRSRISVRFSSPISAGGCSVIICLAML
jgi:hypothetical protein